MFRNIGTYQCHVTFFEYIFSYIRFTSIDLVESLKVFFGLFEKFSVARSELSKETGLLI